MFNFNTTPRLVIGINKLDKLGTLLSDLKIKNPLIVTGPNLSKTSMITKVQEYSWSNNIFCNLVQDPTVDNVIN